MAFSEIRSTGFFSSSLYLFLSLARERSRLFTSESTPSVLIRSGVIDSLNLRAADDTVGFGD